MKIRIEGCTAEGLAEHSEYLTLGRVYECQVDSNGHSTTRFDEGLKIAIRVNPKTFKEKGCEVGSRRGGGVMGKLVLTRRAGESVKLTEPNGETWILKVENPDSGVFSRSARIRLDNKDYPCFSRHLGYGDCMSFAGGNVELRPHKRPDQAILAFDFPRDVTIVRTEIA